jgi:hypothetical protein
MMHMDKKPRSAQSNDTDAAASLPAAPAQHAVAPPLLQRLLSAIPSPEPRASSSKRLRTDSAVEEDADEAADASRQLVPRPPLLRPARSPQHRSGQSYDALVRAHPEIVAHLQTAASEATAAHRRGAFGPEQTPASSASYHAGTGMGDDPDTQEIAAVFGTAQPTRTGRFPVDTSASTSVRHGSLDPSNARSAVFVNNAGSYASERTWVGQMTARLGSDERFGRLAQAKSRQEIMELLRPHVASVEELRKLTDQANRRRVLNALEQGRSDVWAPQILMAQRSVEQGRRPAQSLVAAANPATPVGAAGVQHKRHEQGQADSFAIQQELFARGLQDEDSGARMGQRDRGLNEGIRRLIDRAVGDDGNLLPGAGIRERDEDEEAQYRRRSIQRLRLRVLAPAFQTMFAPPSPRPPSDDDA